MTDDLPASDGARHDEEAVNTPRMTGTRVLPPQDITRFSAETPDIAAESYPADDDDAGPSHSQVDEVEEDEGSAPATVGDVGGPEAPEEKSPTGEGPADVDERAASSAEGSEEAEPGSAEPEAEESEEVEPEKAEVEPGAESGSVEAVDEDRDSEPEAVEGGEEAGSCEPEETKSGSAEPEPGDSEETESEAEESEETEPEETESGSVEAVDEDRDSEPEAVEGGEEAGSCEPEEPGSEAEDSEETESGSAEPEPGDSEEAESEAEESEEVELEKAEVEPGAESGSVEPEPGDSEETEPEETESGSVEAVDEDRDSQTAEDDEAAEVPGGGEEEAGASEDRDEAIAPPVDETLAAMSAATPAEPAAALSAADAMSAQTPAEPAAALSAADAMSAATPADAVSPTDDAPGDSEDGEPTAPALAGVLSKIKEALTALVHGHPSRGMLACVIGAGLLVLIWGGAAVATTQHVFSGTVVSGVDVGGMSPDEARQTVDDRVATMLAQPVTLTVGDLTDTLVPADSGVSVDADATVDQLVGPTINPVTIIQRLRGIDVNAVTSVDADELTIALNSRLDTLAVGTADAVVTLDGTTPVVTPGSTGTGLNVAASVMTLSTRWPLGLQTIALTDGVAEPAITDADARSFVDSVLTPLLCGDLTITAAGTDAERTATGTQLVLTPAQIAALTTIDTTDGKLSAVLDSQGLHDAIIASMGRIETQAVNAGWTIDGSATGAASARPQFVQPVSGEGIDMDALTRGLLDASASGSTPADRTVALPMTVLEPEIDMPESDWGITEVVGEYSTPFTSQYGRDQNLIRGAEQMNNQVVMPGQTFSVEEALGPVDYDHGFTDAGVVSNGEHVDALGGGLSQIGTTMFNVGFEAGMDDVEHHPHSYYFDRYPAGREATIWTGQKDVKFANSTPYAALIQSWVSDGEVHARIWSTHYYDVSITDSGRYNNRPIQTVTRSGAGCEAYSGGNPGFDIEVTRTRKAPDKTVPDDVLTTTYDADNNIQCSSGETGATGGGTSGAGTGNRPTGSDQSSPSTPGRSSGADGQAPATTNRQPATSGQQGRGTGQSTGQAPATTDRQQPATTEEQQPAAPSGDQGANSGANSGANNSGANSGTDSDANAGEGQGGRRAN
ncbi:VanW family protein [uncultured Actinomyces sp.]|uniref:VanW family protein n=3 Tax=uncultured Actinomyces sp. TaxID=249061 RepID=UPI0028EEEB9A|nr:VanW family protein [uncultured Actinomyces sp.]